MPRTRSQIARRDCGSRPVVKFVEKHHFRIVDQGKSNEQSLFLASGEIHEPGAALIGQAELFEQAFPIDGFLW
jgi:hypothetical protein